MTFPRQISFACAFKAEGKARARSANGRHYTPAKTVAFEKAVGFQARAAMSGQPITGPCSVSVFALYAMPKSWSKRKRDEMTGRPHTSKPDGDNILKGVSDALNGIVWTDDALCARMSIEKRWGDADRFSVTVEEMA